MWRLDVEEGRTVLPPRSSSTLFLYVFSPRLSNTSQMTTDRRRTAEKTDQCSESNDGHRLLFREERSLNQPAIDQRVGAVGEPDRDQSAEHALDRPLQQERAPDEAVRRTDEPHDRDLTTPLQHRHPDGGPDDDDGHHRERGPDHDTYGRGDPPQPVQLLDPVATEPDVVHEAESAQPVGDLVHVIDIAELGLELDLDRGGQGIALQLLQHVAELDQLGARAREG